MVVRSPDIDHPVETALEFLHVVSDVRREIGRLAVVADDDAVLFVTERRRPEPARAVFFVDMPGIRQDVDGAFDSA